MDVYIRPVWGHSASQDVYIRPQTNDITNSPVVQVVYWLLGVFGFGRHGVKVLCSSHTFAKGWFLYDCWKKSDQWSQWSYGNHSPVIVVMVAIAGTVFARIEKILSQWSWRSPGDRSDYTYLETTHKWSWRSQWSKRQKKYQDAMPICSPISRWLSPRVLRNCGIWDFLQTNFAQNIGTRTSNVQFCLKAIGEKFDLGSNQSERKKKTKHKNSLCERKEKKN